MKSLIFFSLGFIVGSYFIIDKHSYDDFEYNTLTFLESAYTNGCTNNGTSGYEVCRHNAKGYRDDIEGIFRDKVWNKRK